MFDGVNSPDSFTKILEIFEYLLRCNIFPLAKNASSVDEIGNQSSKFCRIIILNFKHIKKFLIAISDGKLLSIR